MTWYVIDKRTGEIINAIESSREGAERCLGSMTENENLRLDANPPQSVLERYRYYWERP